MPLNSHGKLAQVAYNTIWMLPDPLLLEWVWPARLHQLAVRVRIMIIIIISNKIKTLWYAARYGTVLALDSFLLLRCIYYSIIRGARGHTAWLIVS